MRALFVKDKEWEEVIKHQNPRELLNAQIQYWNQADLGLVGPVSEEIMGKILLDLLGEEARVKRTLDFGCGTGRLYRAFGFKNYVGVDISTTYLKEFQRQNPEATRVLVKELSLPFLDAEFDLIMCYSVFTHLKPTQQKIIMKEFSRVLKEKGQLAVSIFEREVIREPKFNWELTSFPEFVGITEKENLKICSSVKVPERGKYYQTLLLLEKKS